VVHDRVAIRDRAALGTDPVDSSHKFAIIGGRNSHDQPDISGIAPFFIVKNVPAALSFYRDRLGFDITFQGAA